MSYSVIAYQVDSTKIKALWGSKNFDFVASFKSEYRTELDDLVDESDEDSADVYQACLMDIVNGEINSDNDSYLYGYLYELLCQKFGEMIEHDEFMSFLGDVTPLNYHGFIPLPKKR